MQRKGFRAWTAKHSAEHRLVDSLLDSRQTEA